MSDKKVIQLDDRIPKLKAQRRQKTNRRFVFYITLFFLLILIVAYIESPLSNVKEITVSGNRYIQTEQIKEDSGLSSHSKIWSVDAKHINKNLKKIPSIKSVSVTSHYLSGQVVLKITEFQRVAYVQTHNNQYQAVLANGKFMKTQSKNAVPVNAPIVIGFKQGRTLTKLTEQLVQLSPSILYDISEIDFTPTSLYPYGVTLYLNDGHKALADIPSLAKKMSLYPSILASLPKDKNGVVELRVGAYWSPNSSQSSQNGGN